MRLTLPQSTLVRRRQMVVSPDIPKGVVEFEKVIERG